MANQAIATVVSVSGTAYARGEDGQLREIKPGDVLLEGETVVTPNGGSVELALEDGSSLAVAEVPELLLTRDIVAERAASAAESAVEDETVEALLPNLEGEGDILEGLEATAAGAAGAGGAGGGASEGSNFVRLARIAEDTPELSSLVEPSSLAAGTADVPADSTIGVDVEADAAETTEDQPVIIAVLDNDTYADGGVVESVTQPGNGSVTVNANGTVTYTPNEGFVGEDTFTYTSITPDGGAGGTATVTVTVTPTDVPEPPAVPVVSVSIGDASVAEGGVAEVRVTLSAATDSVVTVVFSSADGTATVVGGDYDPVSGTLVFAAGETEKVILVQTNQDSEQEGSEFLTLSIDSATGATVGDGDGRVEIVDNFLPTITINQVRVSEGDVAELTLTLSEAVSGAVTVAFVTQDDSATVIGGDYDAASGTITFTPGSTTAVIQIQTNDDDLVESLERGFVNLSNPVGATLANNQGIFTIVDSTEPPPPPPPPPPPSPPSPVFSVADVSVSEGSVAVVTITRSGDTSQAQTVDVSTVVPQVGVDTAEANDFTTLQTTTVTFAPGQQTATVEISTVSDEVFEGAETFRVELSNPTNGAVVSEDAFGTVTILDDGSGPDPDPENPENGPDDDRPTLTIGDVVAEEGSNAVFAVTVDKASEAAFDVRFVAAVLAGNTAEAADFDAANLVVSYGSDPEQVITANEDGT
ncbi:MAG: retention module-containing protein, partial [Haliea sp.]|nr:retention module-containing protein [Haliea sp.]